MDKESVYYKLLISIVRKGLTALATVLTGWGILDANDENVTTTIIKISAGIVTFLISFWASYKNIIIETVKTKVGIKLPPTTTIERVAEIANAVPNKKEVATGAVELPNYGDRNAKN